MARKTLTKMVLLSWAVPLEMVFRLLRGKSVTDIPGISVERRYIAVLWNTFFVAQKALFFVTQKALYFLSHRKHRKHRNGFCGAKAWQAVVILVFCKRKFLCYLCFLCDITIKGLLAFQAVSTMSFHYLRNLDEDILREICEI